VKRAELSTVVVSREELLQRAQEFLAKSSSENTTRAYRRCWEEFKSWCETHGKPCLPAPPDAAALYLAEVASRGLSYASVTQRLSAISKIHRVNGFASPARSEHVRQMMTGIANTLGRAQHGKAALTDDRLVSVVKETEASKPKQQLRDRAILLFGFSTALRRAELVALNTDDLAWTQDGVIVNVRVSKTDQAGQGQFVAVPYGKNADTCPVRALRAWLDEAGIVEGPLFRSITRSDTVRPHRLTAQYVARFVKKYAGLAGFDPDVHGAHSLRSGIVTSASRGGATEADIMRQTRHQDPAMVRRYTREVELFKNNIVSKTKL
jgi:site-specific recombinase XerD